MTDTSWAVYLIGIVSAIATVWVVIATIVLARRK
jgi:hypothetical protein